MKAVFIILLVLVVSTLKGQTIANEINSFINENFDHSDGQEFKIELGEISKK